LIFAAALHICGGMLAVLGWRTGRGATAGLLEAAPEFDAFDFEKIYHALVMAASICVAPRVHELSEFDLVIAGPIQLASLESRRSPLP
jgi:hypothetical protein